MKVEKNSDKAYYFTWGTLKRGFSNHDKYGDILNNCLGEFVTQNTLSLIVPFDKYCPNPGCKYVHRSGALTRAIPGQSKQVIGEVYEVTQEGLKALDALENYDPNDIQNSTYKREKINLVAAEGGDVISAYCYFIQNDSDYVSLLLGGHAEVVDTYTVEMGMGELKPCCKANPNHTDCHDRLPLPDYSDTVGV